MQELVFEAAWDKTIAPEDRKRIQEIFEETKEIASNGVAFLPFREAFNHENSLLVSVLIHNFNEEVFSLQDLHIAYSEDTEIIATHEFSFPGMTLKGKESMPWTFIFPVSSQNGVAELTDAKQIIRLNREIREIS